MTAPLPEALNELVGRLRRLTPCWNNPERFHEAKSELIADLRRLVQQAPEPTVRRVLVPVERIVERERVVYLPRPIRRRRRTEQLAVRDLFGGQNGFDEVPAKAGESH
ncbi:hypothetical protein [Azospirillum lipoferum]|uniref:Uncharacterized protein n=1 Tax=Azospirillum lipoferum (strain 4B) TaxID=862719 RepID=G7Z5H1_AZOL4|nr:hypothetical protein [Azospirillum lipoferum]CBS87045.1 protein of unknown function [Azospirillum lipoferum 4B]